MYRVIHTTTMSYLVDANDEGEAIQRAHDFVNCEEGSNIEGVEPCLDDNNDFFGLDDYYEAIEIDDEGNPK